MARALIACSTVDGQTLRICSRIQAALEQAGHAVALRELTGAACCEVGAFDLVVIGASIRYGRHRPAVGQFVERHARELSARPSAFFSVNVVARKPGKNTAATNPYLLKFLRKTAWQPTLRGVFAGTIDYPRYGALDRHVIRFIMWLTGGPTDLSSRTEFTDWAAVDAFAAQLVGLLPLA